MRFAVIGLLLTLTVGCAAPKVKELNHVHASGANWSLRHKIDEAPGRTLIVFVHGIGDTCPGYALDSRLGWFSGDTLDRLALDASTDAHDHVIVPDFENRDPASTLVLQRYRYTSRVTQQVVDAAEITWSGLTRWLKDQQLAYDLSDPNLKSLPPDQLKLGQAIRDCITDAGGTFKPPRVYVNKVFKDGLIDRNLSDAVIYAGSYGAKIDREVGESLCRVLQENWSDVQWDGAGHPIPCTWPSDGKTPYTTILFVTHSLGSRIVYDTLLELSGTTLRPDTVVFAPDVIEHAKPLMDRALDNATSIYMMANQLPLIGLAFAAPSQDSKNGPAPLVDLVNEQPAALEPARSDSTAHPRALRSLSQHPMLAIAAQRRNNTRTLDIVAFSDPNDLLSYAIPDWYSDVAGTTKVAYTNVFVRNATRWFGLIENPSTAHSGYIANRNVWKAIACGADDGKLLPCQRAPAR